MAPLWLVYGPRWMKDEPTWRQLTVGEDRRKVAEDLAVGYRAALGRRQWLIYRSLGPKGNRTLLGCNVSSETLVGRFERSGTVKPLLYIE